MASDLPHIFLLDKGEASLYTRPPRKIEWTDRYPTRERNSHSARMRQQWESLWTKAKEQKESRIAVSMPTKDGIYVEFEGAPGYDLVTKSLEDRSVGIRLLSVYETSSATTPEKKTTNATVFIPYGKEKHFLNKIRQYAEENTKKGNPRNADLIESIEDVRLAVLESFWRDDREQMPDGSSPVWCEIWLRGTDSDIEERFRAVARTLGVVVQSRSLRFPERIVLLGMSTLDQLTHLIESSSDIAEFRRAKETARFFLEQENRDQTDWVNDLRARLQTNPDATVAVCILDTGANNGHALLQPVLANADCHAVEPGWGVNDHLGHGTLMCGIAAFGDLAQAMQHGYQIQVLHCLESAKILPPTGANDPDLYGDITIQGLSRAAIQSPARNRIGCMAVTSEDGRDRGRPSSWSAAIDKYTSGYDDDTKRLFVVSAGNNLEHSEWAGYPQNNLTYSIHDPGQSWNALTVGAYTEKALLSDPTLQNHVPLAQPGELSPFSSTSLTWDAKWPIKPEIVLEGGNLAKAPDDFISEHDDLSLLSTGHQPNRRQFDTINATSAAAAQASWMAAQIQARYPNAWPETVRGLMVHSAEWPDALKRQFLDGNGQGVYSKSEYGRLLRICGYGVPNLARALACAANSVTLVSEAEVQPYTKKEGSSNYSTKDMHLHRLPWPREILLQMGEAPVTLRVTLSYFIEPGPGEVGWKDKYRYPSYGLRFSLNSQGETEDIFVKLTIPANPTTYSSPKWSSDSDVNWATDSGANRPGRSVATQGVLIVVGGCVLQG